MKNIHILENSNILNVKSGIICHQTNCIGVMGGGIALSIRQKWPQVYDQYYNYCKSFKDSRMILGDVQTISLTTYLFVANCFGQYLPGHGCMTDYVAWDKILLKLEENSRYFSTTSIHFPWKIGCGLAGGDWSIMQTKIESFFKDSSIQIYFHKFNV
jgi:O-acetyl-ADP-ribose deacetylase (regulator of RNase III)